MRVVVIGLGAMGSAALSRLAQRGITAIGLEQFAVGHDRGSSHGWSRVVRQAYFEHPNYVPLLKRAFTLWSELETQTGMDILHRCGVLIVGSPQSEAIARSRASARQHGIAIEDLDSASLRARYPQFCMPDDHIGLLEPGGGFVIPEHGNAAHLEVARRFGAEIRMNENVLAIEATTDSVRVTTASGAIDADRLIVTAGAWTPTLLPQLLPGRLSPQRKHLVWFEPTDAVACASDRMPAWLIDDGGASGDGVYYGLPTWPNQVGPAGVKVGFHGPGPACDPDARGEVDADRVKKFTADMARYIPSLGAPTASTTCMYTMSDDEHFVLDAAPQMPNTWVAAGFSGHGYKFAPVIGELLADFATGGSPTLDVEFLSAARFGTSSS